MADAAVKTKPATTAEDTERELTDGFHLVIDALKLNGINTIYGVPGIPITDLGSRSGTSRMPAMQPQSPAS
jgi:oxalyl-CoA decarboxylase